MAAAGPEVQKTLERFVYSSLPDATKLSGGKYTRVWHFDSKSAVADFIRRQRGPPDFARGVVEAVEG